MTKRASGLPPSEDVSQTEIVPPTPAQPMPDTPERCTCGTFLVENAVFCHRCGRPVNAQARAQEQAAAPPTPVVVIPPANTVPTPLPIGFGNPIAVRVAFLMSLGILMTALLLSLAIPVWCLTGGWAAAWIYGRLTGLRLSIGAGARLGSLTGVLSSAGIAVMVALEMAVSGKEMLDELSSQMIKQNPGFSEIVNNPTSLGIVLVMSMILIFVIVVGICAAGGALGAKFSPPAEPRT